MTPYQVTKDFERELCQYTGAPYAVAVNSCTMALLLAVAWHHRNTPKMGKVKLLDSGGCKVAAGFVVEIPKRTYISVPMSIIHAGGWPTFRDEEWKGMYQLRPLPVWDSARYFTERLWNQSQGFCCVSFHASKTLGIEQGGAILHDDPEADAWLRRARFDGRTEGVVPKDDTFNQIGWHCYLNPSTAAQGILRLHSLPRYNAPLPNDEYPDLSQMDIFK